MTVVDLALATPLTSRFRATQLVAMLDDDERTRADHFHHHDDRLLYITAHALNRLVAQIISEHKQGAMWLANLNC